MHNPFFPEVDTSHLSLSVVEDAFNISAAHLARLAEECHYRLYGDKILFGIRAAKTLSEKGQWLNSITIKAEQLDFQHLNCLMGIWDRKTSKIAVFQGSTVPFINYLAQQQQNSTEKISNQLAQGLYHYYVGAHEPQSSPKEEGAFRLNTFISVPAWRNLGESNIILDACTPNDNIHAARTEDKGYCSAGCQVISGYHTAPMPTGEYQLFRVLAGLSALPSEYELNLPYQYLLTHVAHLYNINKGAHQEYLMMGSEGWAVRQLQESLVEEKLLSDNKINKGYLDGTTALAIYNSQKQANQFANGIVVL